MKENEMKIASRCVALAALIAVTESATVCAQLRSDAVPRERTIPLETTIKQEADGARFRLGPVRLLPRVNLSNLGYNNNVIGGSGADEAVGDWTGTVAAGLGFLVPFGGSVYLRGEAVPQYTWFKDLAERRSWGGSAAASVLFLPKAFRLEVSGEVRRGTIFYSSEVVTPVVEASQGGRAQIDVPITGRLSVFAVGETRKTIYPNDIDAAFSVTDRKEGVLRGGLAFKATEDLTLMASAERNEARFDRQAIFRDNTGTGVFGAALFDRERLFVNLVVGARRYKPRDSAFEQFSGATGGLFASYFVTRRLEVQFVARRGLSNSVAALSSYFVETTYGGALNYAIGRKLNLGAFAEAGVNRYPQESSPAGFRRQDDLTRLGGTISYSLTPSLGITGRVTRDELDSNVPGVDRSITYFNMGLSLSGVPKSGKN